MRPRGFQATYRLAEEPQEGVIQVKEKWFEILAPAL